MDPFDADGSPSSWSNTMRHATFVASINARLRHLQLSIVVRDIPHLPADDPAEEALRTLDRHMRAQDWGSLGDVFQRCALAEVELVLRVARVAPTIPDAPDGIGLLGRQLGACAEVCRSVALQKLGDTPQVTRRLWVNARMVALQLG